MPIQALRLHVLGCIAGLAFLAFSSSVSADPPSRVARLGYMSGAVSFSPAGEGDWDEATLNRPLTTGDRLWTDDNSKARAELQVGGALVRMRAGTAISVLNLDDRIAQLQLTQGTLNVRIRHLEPDQVFEVDTPNLAFTVRKPGSYRITVDPEGDATTIVVRKGQGEVYGEGAAYIVDARQPYRFAGTGLRDYEYVEAPRADEFDRWAGERDRSYDNSRSARYVSQDVVGYQDLDANGTWRNDPAYGNVWTPNRVAAGWVPYRDGHWSWVDPWGWTWVDDAPWGFAVSHYGRWANLHGNWGWVPGPVRSRAYYAPALVAFVGGSNFQLSVASGNVDSVGWFPLAPREVYRPAYPVSRGYYERVNRSNTVINNTVINNTYNNTNVSQVVFANRHVRNAVVAVPTATFVQSQPVSGAVQRVSRERIARAPVALAPQVAPTEKSVRGAVRGNHPPARVFERPVIARSTPPPAHAGFEAQRPQLTAKPGKPLDAAARKELKPAAVPAPVVKVVAQTKDSPRSMRPPPAPASRTGDARASADQRKSATTPAIPGTSVAPTPRLAPSPAAPPLPATQAAEPRGKGEQRGRGEQRGQAVTPPPAPAGAAQPQSAPPQVKPTLPLAQPPERGGRGEARDKVEQRGRGEQRGQSVTPPPTPSGAAQPQSAPPQVKTSLPPAQPPERGGRGEARDKTEQRGAALSAPPTPPQGAAPSRITPRQETPAVPAVQAPERGGRAEQGGRGERPAVAAPPAPAQAPAARSKPERRGNGEEREQRAAPPPAQRAPEPKAIPPQAAPPVAAPQTPPPRPAPPKAAPPPQVAPAAPAPKPPPQVVMPARPAPPPPAAAPPPAAQQPAPQAGPRGQAPKPDAGKPNERKKDSDEERRKQGG